MKVAVVIRSEPKGRKLGLNAIDIPQRQGVKK
jgi:hypothetical protein